MKNINWQGMLLIACTILPGVGLADATLQDVVNAIQNAQGAYETKNDLLAQILQKTNDNTLGYLQSLYNTKVQADTLLMLAKSPVEDVTRTAMINLNNAEQFANIYKSATEVNLWDKSMLGLVGDQTVTTYNDLSDKDKKDAQLLEQTAQYKMYNELKSFCSVAADGAHAIKDCQPIIANGMTPEQYAYAPYKVSTLLGIDGYNPNSQQAALALDFISNMILGFPEANVQATLRNGQGGQLYIAKTLVKETQYSAARYSLTEAYANRLQQPSSSQDGQASYQPSEMELITQFTKDSLSENTLSGIAQASNEALLRSLYYQMAFNNHMQVKLYKQGERIEVLLAANMARMDDGLKEQAQMTNSDVAKSMQSSGGFRP